MFGCFLTHVYYISFSTVLKTMKNFELKNISLTRTSLVYHKLLFSDCKIFSNACNILYTLSIYTCCFTGLLNKTTKLRNQFHQLNEMAQIGTNMLNASLFSGRDQASSYKKFRPKYPKQLYDTIMEYLGEKISPPFKQAIDVGCGSGQNTRTLAQHFDHVLGVDISKAQIDEATRTNDKDNVQYRVGSFSNLFLPNQSTDLVTCAESAHWFSPIEDFYKEVDRVLRPGGVLAIFGYSPGNIHCEGYETKELTKLMWEFLRDETMMITCPPVEEVWMHYPHFELPYPGWKRLESPDINQIGTIADLLGFLSTTVRYLKHLNEDGVESDPLKELANKYQKVFGDRKNLDEIACTMTFPVFLLIGRK